MLELLQEGEAARSNGKCRRGGRSHKGWERQTHFLSGVACNAAPACCLCVELQAKGVSSSHKFLRTWALSQNLVSVLRFSELKKSSLFGFFCFPGGSCICRNFHFWQHQSLWQNVITRAPQSSWVLFEWCSALLVEVSWHRWTGKHYMLKALLSRAVMVNMLLFLSVLLLRWSAFLWPWIEFCTCGVLGQSLAPLCQLFLCICLNLVIVSALPFGNQLSQWVGNFLKA